MKANFLMLIASLIWGTAFVSQTTGISTLILINSHALLLLGSLIAFGILWGWFLKKQLGGFTGDTLGATQQLSEILIYIIISAIP